MKYHFLDQYRETGSFIHKLDPRVKFLAMLVMVIAVVAVPRTEWLAYGLFLILNVCLILLSRVPVAYVLKRSSVVIPFVLLVVVFLPFFKEGAEIGAVNIWNWHIGIKREGLLLAADIMCKAWLSIQSIISLTATTGMGELLKGLEKLKMPRIMIMLMSFMSRYVFVLSDEAEHLSQARNSRSFGGGIRLHVRTLGFMVGALFIRSFERGERVYGAMLARGFEGHSRFFDRLSLHFVDVVYLLIILVASAVIVLIPLLLRSISG
ncbi:MAG: cobalt ECF transporter T component CbiQ [Dehalococcoidia bacterium]|nr:cobalt ECF transporter T component CbiQ [Dehalococcoidia bacterium]